MSNNSDTTTLFGYELHISEDKLRVILLGIVMIAFLVITHYMRETGMIKAYYDFWFNV